LKVKINNETKNFQSIWWETATTVKAIDQRKLPFSFELYEAKNVEDICFAIKEMVVRGAPLIGVSAAYGLVLEAISYQGETTEGFIAEIEAAASALSRTRPTAVDLFNTITKMQGSIDKKQTVKANQGSLRRMADEITRKTINECQAIGKVGNQLITSKITNIMTICNAGALATVDFGTALAPIRHANDDGKKLVVYVSETRPRLQGARLTAWELFNEGIEHYIHTDNSAGHIIKEGKVDMVIVGADRIVLNGDTANKIGTYILSVLCKEHNVPFYVAAPLSTFDNTTQRGKDIIIEERAGLEVQSALSIDDVSDTKPKRRIIHHPYSPNINPAFDVTPAENITGIITPKGILNEPFEESIKQILEKY